MRINSNVTTSALTHAHNKYDVLPHVIILFINGLRDMCCHKNPIMSDLLEIKFTISFKRRMSQCLLSL